MKDFFKFNIWSFLVIAFCVAFALLNWEAIPNHLPVHFDLNGHPDQFQNREKAWFALPLTNILCLIVIHGGLRFAGRSEDFKPALKSLGILNLGLTALLMSLFLGMILEAMTGQIELFSRVLFLGVGLFMMFLGSFFARLEKEPGIGLILGRLLRSGVSGQKMYRVCGRIFFGLGVFVFVAAVFDTPPWLPLLSLVLAGLMSLGYFFLYFLRSQKS